VNCLSQNEIKKEQSKVRLVKWSTENCDTTYAPYRLQSRLTRLESKNDITFVTVNFSDNCCAEFNPMIEFKDNKLNILPYKKYLGNYCTCNCCFAINFEIKGIANKEFVVYFKNEKIKMTDNHYKTIEPTYQFHNGVKINHLNKYGFKEGIWMEFYENGAQKSLTKYPESSLYYESDYEWSKSFYESGRVSHYSRKDTTETWFGDGELESQIISYSSSDTTLRKGMIKHENRNLKERFLERFYPTVFRSEFDSTKERKGSKLDYKYKEEYYLNGQRKYLQTNDTIFTWFESGQVQHKRYNTGSIEYNEKGELIKKSFYWKEPGVKGWWDLNHALYIDYFINGNIEQIHFVRDEPSKNGKSLAPSVHYYWKWDNESKLIESPTNWKEEYPWRKINEIKVSTNKQ